MALIKTYVVTLRFVPTNTTNFPIIHDLVRDFIREDDGLKQLSEDIQEYQRADWFGDQAREEWLQDKVSNAELEEREQQLATAGFTIEVVSMEKEEIEGDPA